jgi:hypothetical protein
MLPAPNSGLRRSLAGALIALALFFSLTWARSIADVLSGVSLVEYQQDPTLFWLIRLMDLGFVIPAALITGAGLLRDASWATRMSYAITGFLTLEVGAVACMAIAMVARDDPSAGMPLLVVTLASTLALAALFLRLLRTSGASAGPQLRRAPSHAAN